MEWWEFILAFFAGLTALLVIGIPVAIAFNVLDHWLGFIAGRLAILAVASGTLLAMLTGVAMGSVAMLGSTLTPEMERRGYSKAMSIGPVLGSGALAILMPSSTLAIVLAS